MRNKNQGFTLIELLVVISIMGLMSSIIMVTVNNARAKARDARRHADMKQLQTALELYYDANGEYPYAANGAAAPNSGWSNSNDSSWTTLQGMLSAYMTRLPVDPKQSSSGWSGWGNYTYSMFSTSYGCNQQWYMIVYNLEIASGPDPGVKACDGTFFQYGGSGAHTTVKTIGVGR